jgi:membrane dipeptidase
MRKFTLLCLLLLSNHIYAQNATEIHQKAIFIDTHNDVLSGQILSGDDLAKPLQNGNFDLVRARAGGLDGQIFSIWCSERFGKGTGFARATREIDSLYALIRRNPSKITLVRNAKQLTQAVNQGKFAALIGVEGGHMIEDRLDLVDSLARRGMCYLTLTWNNSTSWASSAHDETTRRDSLEHPGLTGLGVKIVGRLNELGVMVDVSHVGEQTFYDVLKTSTKPVIASHSCAYALAPVARNLKDAQLKALAKNGGVVFLNFYSGFLDAGYFGKVAAFQNKYKTELDSLLKVYVDKDLATTRLNAAHPAEAAEFQPPLSLLIKHIDYMVKLIGADHVGIGSDFDGAESYPVGMDDVSDFPKITAELVKLHYSESDIRKILGGNFLRVLKANTGE